MNSDFRASQYLADLVYWIKVREAVRERKEAGEPPPWSSDPIINTTRFCNIRREDDKVTKWLRQNWYNPNEGHPNLAFSACLARVVNWPPTLEALGFPYEWNLVRFVEKMTELSGGGHNKIWGGAYMVTGGFSKGGETKQTIIGRVLTSAYFYAQDVEEAVSLKHMYDLVSRAPGLGSFLAAQVVADLKYCKKWDNGEMSDWWTFCAPGPGSRMGLNFLHGRQGQAGMSDAQFSKEVNEIRLWLNDNVVELTAHDTQNCLCEFSKYVRIKYLNGRAKTKYHARS